MVDGISQKAQQLGEMNMSIDAGKYRITNYKLEGSANWLSRHDENPGVGGGL